MRRLAIAMSLVFLAGCGTGNPPPTPKERAEQKQLRQLMVAAATGKMETVAELLEEDPTLIKLQDNGRSTALTFALGNMNPPPREEMIAFLLDKGADVNVAGGMGETALHRATNKGDARIIALLLAHGAEPNAKNIHGVTPLDRALWSGKEEAAMVLLDHGAKPDFFHAAAMGRVDWLKSMLERDAGLLNKTDSETRHPATNGRGAGTYGWTALHWAARHGRIEAIKFLLERGADPTTEDRMMHWRASDLAAEHNHVKVKGLLEEAERQAEGRASRQ